MSNAYTATLNRLIEEFGKLPGIGPKSAERLAFCNLSEADLCQICSDPRRDRSLICIVEQPKDVISLEKTGACQWLYHVLGGHIAPLEGTDARDLGTDKLMARARTGVVKEIIMATNPNLQGDGTSLYISSLLKPFGIKITRLARG